MEHYNQAVVKSREVVFVFQSLIKLCTYILKQTEFSKVQIYIKFIQVKNGCNHYRQYACVLCGLIYLLLGIQHCLMTIHINLKST